MTMTTVGEDQEIEDSDDSEQYKTKKKTKISREEAEQKLHEIQMVGVQNDIINMINQRIESSPRYS